MQHAAALAVVADFARKFGHFFGAHVPGTLRKGKTPLPSDAAAVYEKAVPDDPVAPRNWYGRNEKGQIYRFADSNDGTAHFSG